MGMYDVHSSPVLCLHVEQWHKGMLMGSFSSGVGVRGWWGRETEVQWHCAKS
jgi:hypothetical protein